MDENPLYTIIAILDPRVKGTWIWDHYSNGVAKIAEVRRLLHQLYPHELPQPTQSKPGKQ
jgi:hypothetical protein